MKLSSGPKVFLIAQTTTLSGVDEWLSHIDGQAARKHISGSPPETLIELAARRCYNSFKPGVNPNVTRILTDSKAFHHNILESGHGSVLEHAWSTWAFEGVSRVFTHEMVRNRAGLAYSQESLRYVRLGELTFWLPPEIEENPKAEQLFRQVIHSLEEAQHVLAELFGVDKLSFNTKKQLTSAFRRIAPIGLSTGIVVSFNMRALRHVIEQRTSPAAEIEMRIVFNEVAEIADLAWPMLFQDFCPEDADDGGPQVWVPNYHKV